MQYRYAPNGRNDSHNRSIVEPLETRRLLSGDGLKGEYFNDLDLTAPVLNRIDPVIHFDWGYGAPAAGIGADTFSVRWTGQIEAEKTETYTFHTRSDDGVRLWVNDQLIIDNWTIHAPTTNTGSIDLIAGQKYDIRLEYFDQYNGAVSQLSWSSPTTPKQIIPQERLYSSSAESAVLSVTVVDETASEEGPEAGILRFSRTGDISTDAQVRVSLSGTADAPGDFTSDLLNGFVTIPAGQSSVDIAVTPVDDTTEEGPETLIVTLVPFGNQQADAEKDSATLVIVDNDAAKPVISMVATTPDAYEEGEVAGVFTISRTGDTSSKLSIRLGGFGTAGALDYRTDPEHNAYVTIPAGESSTTITVTPIEDDIVEGRDTVSLYFMPFIWEYDLYDFEPDTATVTIHDNDEPASNDAVYLSDLTPTSATSAHFPVQEDKSVLGRPITIGGQTFEKGLGVHASSTVIYELNGDYGTFETWVGVDDAVGDGATDGTVEFRVYADDRLRQTVYRTGADPAERVVVNVANAQTLRLEVTTGGDNDYKDHANWADAKLYPSLGDEPVVRILPIEPVGDELREDYITFRIERTGDTSTPLSVLYSLGGQATTGEDYELFSPSSTTDPYTIIIPADHSHTTLSFQLTNDDLLEGDETIVVTLVDAPAYSVDDAASSEIGVIRDDETPPTELPAVMITAGASSLAESTDSTTIRIERTGDTTAELPLDLSITGDAVLGDDYIMNIHPDEVRIPAGQSFVEFSFHPVRDLAIEGDEVAVFTIQPGAGYVLGTPNTVGVTIVDNDFPPTVTGETYISDLTPTAAQSPYFGVHADRSVLGNPLTIGGQVFARGLGVHSASTVTYAVPAGIQRFSAMVGIDDEVGNGSNDGSAVFEVWADGVLVASSPRLTGADGPFHLQVDLGTDTDTVTLVATTGGDGDYKDHADWADAKFHNLEPNVWF